MIVLDLPWVALIPFTLFGIFMSPIIYRIAKMEEGDSKDMEAAFCCASLFLMFFGCVFVVQPVTFIQWAFEFGGWFGGPIIMAVAIAGLALGGMMTHLFATNIRFILLRHSVARNLDGIEARIAKLSLPVEPKPRKPAQKPKTRPPKLNKSKDGQVVFIGNQR